MDFAAPWSRRASAGTRPWRERNRSRAVSLAARLAEDHRMQLVSLTSALPGGVLLRPPLCWATMTSHRAHAAPRVAVRVAGAKVTNKDRDRPGISRRSGTVLTVLVYVAAEDHDSRIG
jgi:hypothetical protein